MTWVVGVWMGNGMVSSSRDSCILSVRLAQQLVMAFWICWLRVGSQVARLSGLVGCRLRYGRCCWSVFL